MSYSPLPQDLAAAKAASQHTVDANKAILSELTFTDRRSFENAQRGFIATLDPLTITRDNGNVSYDLSRFSFLYGEAPDTVNPSLWRQAQLNAQHHGLFEITPGLYQVRSFDIANMTLIAGDSGWIIVDPLTSSESSRAALDLANKHLGEREVTGVLITHSHADHFAGILGVVTAADVDSGKVPVLAPEHFVDESLNENVLAGNVMNRRATYMYGNLLKPSPTGIVTTGLGAALSMGTTGFVVPTVNICNSGEVHIIDGVEIEFQMTPGTEAPAEFVFYLPKFKALCMSEITSHHLHNVYTLRGAQVRDALAWSQQINESIELFGARLEIQFACHHWPIWGRVEALEYLSKQRDLYKFIHDQTLRLANKGFTKEEIAERVQLPEALGGEFYNRGYYGSLHHNTRAVYVKYLGYFDGNPSTLYALPQSESASAYVEYMGGVDAIMVRINKDFLAGKYRWVAEVLNHVVMHNVELVEPRALLADTLEQLGYQSESAPWRNFFLCGALELRHGLPESSKYAASEGIAQGMPLKNLFQLMAVRLMPSKCEELSLHINLQITDSSSQWLLSIENSVLNAYENKQCATPTATLKSDTLSIKRMFFGLTSAATLVQEEKLSIDGDLQALAVLSELFDIFPRRFPIVTPRVDD